MSIYHAKGFAERLAYLSDVADCFGLHLETVQACADLLGQEEDFDGLLSMVGDIADHNAE